MVGLPALPLPLVIVMPVSAAVIVRPGKNVAHPVALPLAVTPVGACPVVQRVGVDASAAAVVAAIVPLPDTASEPPVPTTSALVLVAAVISLNDGVPPTVSRSVVLPPSRFLNLPVV